MKFSATLFIFAFFALTTNALPASSVTQENGPGGVVNHVEGPGAISSSHSESITRITTNDGESISDASAALANNQSQLTKAALAKYL
ncbi:hypothetical protein HPULCUR_004837 [Helicostylum pulchrum]|uniref:Uncharacterized protein n=1 Tax=Helicostylum pulchrum TaxID=562976 RepID=A0ABP9XXC4_9FUNG